MRSVKKVALLKVSILFVQNANNCRFPRRVLLFLIELKKVQDIYLIKF